MRKFCIICCMVLICAFMVSCMSNKEHDAAFETSSEYYEQISSTEVTTLYEETSAEVIEEITMGVKPGLADIDVGDIEITTTVRQPENTEEVESVSESVTESLTDEYNYEYETHYQAYTLDWNKAILYGGFELLVPVNYEYVYYMDGWDTYVGGDNSYLRTRYTEDEDSIPIDKLYEALEEDFSTTYSPYTMQAAKYNDAQITVYVYKDQGVGLEVYKTILPVGEGFVYLEYKCGYESGINFMTLLNEMG